MFTLYKFYIICYAYTCSKKKILFELQCTELQNLNKIITVNICQIYSVENHIKINVNI